MLSLLLFQLAAAAAQQQSYRVHSDLASRMIADAKLNISFSAAPEIEPRLAPYVSCLMQHANALPTAGTQKLDIVVDAPPECKNIRELVRKDCDAALITLGVGDAADRSRIIESSFAAADVSSAAVVTWTVYKKDAPDAPN